MIWSPYQGCALAEPGGLWRLTFVLWRLENLCFFTEIICWANWISQVQSTGLPLIFLRAQPCLSHCCVCWSFARTLRVKKDSQVCRHFTAEVLLQQLQLMISLKEDPFKSSKSAICNYWKLPNQTALLLSLEQKRTLWQGIPEKFLHLLVKN